MHRCPFVKKETAKHSRLSEHSTEQTKSTQPGCQHVHQDIHQTWNQKTELIQMTLPGTWGHLQLCLSLSHAHCSQVTMPVLTGLQGHAHHSKDTFTSGIPGKGSGQREVAGQGQPIAAWQAGWHGQRGGGSMSAGPTTSVPLRSFEYSFGGTSCVLGGAQPSLGIADLGPTGRLVGHGKLAGIPYTSVFSHFFNKHFGPHILSNVPEPGAILVGPPGTQNSPSRPRDLEATWALSCTQSIQCGDHQGWGRGRCVLCAGRPRVTSAASGPPPLWWLLVRSPGPSPGTVTPFQPLPVYVFKTFPEQRL